MEGYQWGGVGGEWDNCNSIINTVYLKNKQTNKQANKQKQMLEQELFLQPVQNERIYRTEPQLTLA